MDEKWGMGYRVEKTVRLSVLLSGRKLVVRFLRRIVGRELEPYKAYSPRFEPDCRRLEDKV